LIIRLKLAHVHLVVARAMEDVDEEVVLLAERVPV